MLVLDGSYGEGGGQIVRTSLSLAALTDKPVRLVNIRTGRAKPGLRPQHLTAVQALAQITRAELTGATIGSTHLTFSPRGIYPGSYIFDVAEKTGSAGSVSLVAQTLLPVLLFAQSPSTLIIKGGTHVPWSPPVHYLMAVFLPALREMGVSADLKIKQWGFYPQGGGEIVLQVNPAPQLTISGLDLAAGSRNLSRVVSRSQSSGARQAASEPVGARPPGMAPAHPGRKCAKPGKGQLCFSVGTARGFCGAGGKGKARGTGGCGGSPGS